MNRPIKFRARDYFTGEWHYGFYLEDEDGVHIFENKCAYPVDPDSVAQLVGYDKDGKEVYEGDKLTNFMGEEFTAELFGGVIAFDGVVQGTPAEVLKLKEAEEDEQTD